MLLSSVILPEALGMWLTSMDCIPSTWKNAGAWKECTFLVHLLGVMEEWDSDGV